MRRETKSEVFGKGLKSSSFLAFQWNLIKPPRTWAAGVWREVLFLVGFPQSSFVVMSKGGWECHGITDTSILKKPKITCMWLAQGTQTNLVFNCIFIFAEFYCLLIFSQGDWWIGSTLFPEDPFSNYWFSANSPNFTVIICESGII